MELAIAKLAISTLSPIIEKLGGYVHDSYFGGSVTAEEMENLTDVVLPTIKAIIQEAELVPLQHLEPWIEKLQTAAFEAEDLIDLYEYKKIENQVCSLPKRIKKYKNKTKQTLRFMLPKSSLRVSLEKLQESAEQAKKLLPLIESARSTAMIKYKSPQASSSTSTSTGSTLSSRVFGREEECDTIIKFLLEESDTDSNGRKDRIPIIAIQGIGGSGKTSTSQGVYNDGRVEIFDLRMWVYVSRSFDVRRLTKEIIESAIKRESPRIDNLDVLQTRLKELVSKAKKFLLVLDNIWCEDKMQWDQLLSPLNEVKGNGSKIIITTRTEEVASILQVDQIISLKELKIEDCWSILKHYAFGNSKTTIEDSYLTNIGNQIIRKVKYSPLALRIVGSSMGKRVNINEWENILRQDALKETIDVLLLTFHHLPSHLQRCFAYCSLFPKGYRFNDCRKELIPLWIAQGFVENTNESDFTVEEKGEMYFKELVSYSFFSVLDIDYYYGYFTHDLLHDVAEKVSKKYCHRIEDDSLDIHIPATCIHLSICLEDWRKVAIPDMSKLRKLRSLVIPDMSKLKKLLSSTIPSPAAHKESFIDKKVEFQNLTKLRALHVSFRLQMEVKCEPDIAKLKHLRYLMVRYDRIPRLQLAKLYHLQFLHLAGYPVITDPFFCNSGENPVDILQADNFPQGFENLINLRSLNFYCEDGYRLDYFYCYPELNVRKLKSLQNLGTFCPKKDGVNRMMPLQNLNLRGAIFIKNLENVKSEAEAAEAMLNKKKNLNELRFEWSGTLNDGSNSCKEVLEGLQPHPNLKSLHIEGYQGLKAPKWMINENCLPCLLELRLFRCKSLKEIPYLPPRLNKLRVVMCNDLMQLPPVGDALQFLALEYCSKLQTSSIKSPCLSHFEMKRCARNESQLFNDLPFLTSLQELRLEGICNLETFPKLNHTVKYLSIIDFPKLTSLGNLQQCTSLEHLIIGNLLPEAFTTLPSLEKLSSLKDLDIIKCPYVEFLPDLPINLQELCVYDCPNIKVKYGEGGQPVSTISHFSGYSTAHPFSGPNLEHCISLKILRLKDCPMLMTDVFLLLGKHKWSVKILVLDGSGRPFPPLLEDNLQKCSVEELRLGDFTTLPSLGKLSSLLTLAIGRCHDVKSLPNLPISLKLLYVDDCPDVKSLPYLPISMTSLEVLDCPDVELLPNLPTSLQYVWIHECPNLKEKYEVGGQLHNTVSHVPELRFS